MIVPTVSLNGTSQEDLVEQHRAAADATMTAIGLLRRAYPNARDFQLDPPETLKWAQREATARELKLTSVRNELMELALAISQQ